MTKYALQPSFCDSSLLSSAPSADGSELAGKAGPKVGRLTIRRKRLEGGVAASLTDTGQSTDFHTDATSPPIKRPGLTRENATILASEHITALPCRAQTLRRNSCENTTHWPGRVGELR